MIRKKTEKVWSNDSNLLIVIGFSLFFVILNLVTLEWTPLPWIDEISYSDYSVNFVLDGEWRTTAWFGDKNNEAYSVYPPLYQFVLVPWVWLFGVSPLACRSLSVILAFICCLVIYRVMKKANLINSRLILICFLLLFWGADLFSWMYRNGRVDILNMLCTTCFFSCFYNYLLGSGNKWWLVFWSFLVFISGIQACPLIGGVLILLLLFQRKIRVKTINALFLILRGYFLGLCGLSLFFGLQGHLLSFYYRTFIFSSSLKKVALVLLPYFADVLNINVNEFTSKLVVSESVPFSQKLLDAYVANVEYLIVSAINILVFSYIIYKKQLKLKSQEGVLGLVVFSIPLLMGLAGRFSPYYTWMCYIPAIMYMVYLCARFDSKPLLFIYTGMTCVIVSFGLPQVLYKADKDSYSNVENFIRKQNFSSNDKIISPFVSYYPIRNITKHCYFTGIYPLTLVPEDTRYILKAVDDFGYQNMDTYIQQCKKEGKKVTLVDQLESPKMELFVIE